MNTQSILTGAYDASHLKGKTVVLNNGIPVQLRPLAQTDRRQIRKLFRDLSAESYGQRFFTPRKKQEPPVSLHPGTDQEIAVVAVTVQNTSHHEIIGLAQLLLDLSANDAEYAVVVADQWQGFGLGSRFTDYALGIARMRDITKVFSVYLVENQKMNKIFRKRNFKIIKTEGIYRAELVLSNWLTSV